MNNKIRPFQPIDLSSYTAYSNTSEKTEPTPAEKLALGSGPISDELYFDIGNNDEPRFTTTPPKKNSDSSIMDRIKERYGGVVDKVNSFFAFLDEAKKAQYTQLIDSIKPVSKTDKMFPQIADFKIDATDIQYIASAKTMGVLNIINKLKELDPNYDYQGKTIKEILFDYYGELCTEFDISFFKCKTLDEFIQMCPEEFRWDLNMVQNSIKYGYGEMMVAEVVTDSYGTDIIVFEDQAGDFTFHFKCTNAKQFGDLIFDAANVIDYNFGVSVDDMIPYRQKQNEAAQKVVEKYLKLADESGNKVNLTSYSLGGGLQSNALYNVVDEGNYYDVLGKVCFFNALQDGSIDDTRYQQIIERLGKQGKLEMFATNGDIVHCTNHPWIQEYTHYISCGYEKGEAGKTFVNWKDEFGKLMSDSTARKKDFGKWRQDLKEWKENFIGTCTQFFFGDVHSEGTVLDKQTISEKSFDENGKFIENDIVPLTCKQSIDMALGEGTYDGIYTKGDLMSGPLNKIITFLS